MNHDYDNPLKFLVALTAGMSTGKWALVTIAFLSGTVIGFLSSVYLGVKEHGDKKR